MNPWMITDLADFQVREIRRQAAKCGGTRRRPGPRRAYVANRWLLLRHRVGFGLVEAGLHVLATSRPQAGLRAFGSDATTRS